MHYAKLVVLDSAKKPIYYRTCKKTSFLPPNADGSRHSLHDLLQKKSLHTTNRNQTITT